MAGPSTEWHERIAETEAARFEQIARTIGDIQREVTARDRVGRSLHRNQRLGFRARFEVLPDLPAHARHGIFAEPRTYDATVRLSNGSHSRLPDRAPDVRGFAVRISGVSGAGALGIPTTAQCFVMINSEVFSFPNADEFIDVVRASTKGQLAVLRVLMKRYGFFGGLRRAMRLGKGLGAPFAGFADTTFYSAAPLACGPYAMKLRLVPTTPRGAAVARVDDATADMHQRLAAGELTWDVQAQFFVDEQTTPIEDPTLPWPDSAAPYVTVARLRAARQDTQSEDGKALDAAIENDVFDPWAALVEHRPLGEIMRARKAAYLASQRGRGVA